MTWPNCFRGQLAPDYLALVGNPPAGPIVRSEMKHRRRSMEEDCSQSGRHEIAVPAKAQIGSEAARLERPIEADWAVELDYQEGEFGI